MVLFQVSGKGYFRFKGNNVSKNVWVNVNVTKHVLHYIIKDRIMATPRTLHAE